MATNIKEKYQSLSEGLTRINSNTFTKIINELGESPEKLRTLLNFLIVPGFKPKFETAQDSSGAAIEFLSVPNAEPGQSPYRMFDVDTGNLIEFPALGVLGQYAMLSHRWKGAEVTLAHIQRARLLDRDRQNAGGVEDGARDDVRKNDVNLVLEQCRLDVLEQESVIKGLTRSIPLDKKRDVRALLLARLQVKAKRWAFEAAKKAEDQAVSKLRFARMEREVIAGLIDDMTKEIDDEMKMNRVLPLPTNERGQEARSGETGATLETSTNVDEAVKTAEEAVKRAHDDLGKAEDALGYADIGGDASLFDKHGRLREAVDGMISRLQLWKSAIKLQQATIHSREVFKQKFFEARERNYLWLDTCCIDKQNAGELAESLSLMGDWYANAEFCLIQLDTQFEESDALLDWDSFQKQEGRQVEHSPAPCKPNIENFKEILDQRHEWAERGWTLQELVMSKSTFFANAEWKLLSRPVESLGYYYYLMPYIAQYTHADSRNPYLESLNEQSRASQTDALISILPDNQIPENHNEDHDKESIRIKRAHKLILILEGLGVRISKDVVMETATSEIAQAVYLAATDLDSKNGRESGNAPANVKLLDKLRTRLHRDVREDGESTAYERAQHLINLLLQCLVVETKELILDDRRRIAELGQVNQLERWQEGIQRWGFSVQKVLDLSCRRKVTVATDHVYSLMGVLGVRFPTFHAEGYCKALSRLLDEVVITHNDVSVFNWTGMEMGSPIRGRSMYPSSHRAYSADEDRGQRGNMVLSSKIKDKLAEVTNTYKGVIFMLTRTIKYVKENGGKQPLPFLWLHALVDIINKVNFDHLQPGLDTLRKIFGYILEKWTPPSPPPRSQAESGLEKEGKAAKEEVDSPGTKAPSSSFGVRPSLTGFGRPSTKKEKDIDSKPKFGVPNRLPGLGKSFNARTPFGKKSTAEQLPPPTPEPEPITRPNNADHLDKSVESPQDSSKDPPPESPESPESPEMPDSRKEFEDKVMCCIEQIGGVSESGNSNSQTLPDEFNYVDLKLPTIKEPETSTSHVNEPGRNMISPNPIIVNNSGIEGIFDIQRVIVTMIGLGNLRKKVANAASPHERISGWCHISTGFARVVTNFACQKHILEKELDVVAAVESKVLKEQDKDSSQKRMAKLRRSLSMTFRHSSREQKSGPATEQIEKEVDEKKGEGEERTGEREEKEGGEGEKKDVEGSSEQVKVEAEEGTEPGVEDHSGNTEDERAVSRMINFIQETELDLVAGEWVLARFSGVAGARWFLCYLELGSTHQFYGHRIPTGEIDFHNATPEPGLVNVWQTYMDRKKRKMCKILRRFLQSKETARVGEEKRKEGTELAIKSAESLLDLSKVRASPTSPDARCAGDKGLAYEVEDSSDASESGESEGEDDEQLAGASRTALEKGKFSAKAFFEFGVLAAVEKILEMRADHLEKHLSMSVLKRTPKCLRTAMENMNDNKSFLPSMFHSATRVHMF